MQQVARSTTNATRGLDDYNPFDGQQNANQPMVYPILVITYLMDILGSVSNGTLNYMYM